MGRSHWSWCCRNRHCSRLDYDRSTSFQRDLNIGEWPGLQNLNYLQTGQRIHSGEVSRTGGANCRCISLDSLRRTMFDRYMYNVHSIVHCLGSKGHWRDTATGRGSRDRRPRKSKGSLMLICHHSGSSKFGQERCGAVGCS